MRIEFYDSPQPTARPIHALVAVSTGCAVPVTGDLVVLPVRSEPYRVSGRKWIIPANAQPTLIVYVSRQV